MERKTYIDIELRAENVQKRLAQLTVNMTQLTEKQKELQAEQRRLAKEQNAVAAATEKLTAAYNAGEISLEQYNEQLAPLLTEMSELNTKANENAAALSNVTAELQPLKKEMSDATLDAKALGQAMQDTLDGQRAELRLMLREYDALTTAEKNADKGQELQQHIEELTAAISVQEEATGRFQRTVGKYKSIWSATTEEMEGFGKVLSSIFGANSPITQAATRVVGLGKGFVNLAEQAPQAATAMNATATATANVSNATANATRNTIGFNRAETAAASAATETAAAETAQAGATAGLSGALKSATAGLKAMTKAALKFIATPIGALLAAIGVALAAVVATLNRLKNAIKQSDDASTSFARVLAVLKAPLQLLDKAFNALAASLGKAADAFADVAKTLMPEKLRQEAEAEDELVRATDRLEDKERDYAINHAFREREIAEARNKAVQSAKYSVTERIKFLSQAIEAEMTDVRQRKAIADEKLRIFELEHRNSVSITDEEKNRLTDLKNAKIQADTEMLASQRKLNKSMNTLLDELIGKAGDLAESYKDIVANIQEVYRSQALTAVKDAFINTGDAILDFDRNFEDLKKVLSDDDYWTAADAVDELREAYQSIGRENPEVTVQKMSDATDRLKTILGDTDKTLEKVVASVDAVKSAYQDVAEAETQSLKSAEDKRKAASQKSYEERKKAVEKAEAELTKRIESNRDARINLISNEYLKSELLAKSAYEKQAKDLEKALKEQDAIRKKYAAKPNSEEYKNAVAQIEQIKQARIYAEEAYYQTIKQLASKRESDLTTIYESNEDLRIEIMMEGSQKMQAAFELQMRRYDKEAIEIERAYNRTKEELKKAYNERLITEDNYHALSEANEASFLAELERIDLNTQKTMQAHLKERYEANIKTISDALAKIKTAYDDALKNVESTDLDAKISVLESKKKDLQQLYDSLSDMSEADALKEYGSLDAWKEKIKEVGDAYDETAKEIESTTEAINASTLKAFEGTLSAGKTLASSLAANYQQKYSEIKESGEELTEAQKKEALSYAESQYHATLAGIILDQAKGIASTFVAGARAMAETPGGPIIKTAAMAAVVASGIASLISGITSANQAAAAYESQKSEIMAMATGGLVQGAGTATSDSIPARLSNGESVLTAKATAAHYDTLSRWNVEGGGVPFPNAMQPVRHHFAQGGVALDTKMLAEAVKEAVSGVQPVVSVKEITNVQNKVKAKEATL